MDTALRGGIDTDQCVQEHCAGRLRWDLPESAPQGTLILAHGAGAPMDSEFMQQMAQRLVRHGVTVVRFEFDYMAARRLDGKKRPPNPQAKLLEQWREVFMQVRQQVAGKLAVGGKSMGGRMASLVADELGADRLICLGYPFYAVGKPEKPRVAHLATLRTPTLIIQGERDALGNSEAVAGYELSCAIDISWLEAADHDFKPLKSSGFTQGQHIERAAAQVARFIIEPSV